METTVNRRDLAKTLSQANRFVSSKAQLPVLNNILLDAKKTKLTVMATNLEMSFSAQIGAKSTTEGTICVPARMITDLLTTISSETVSLKTDKESLNIATDSFSASVSGLNSSDFPEVPRELSEKGISIKRENLIKALSKVLFSVSSDEVRPQFTGVLFSFSGEELSLISSDGFRLSKKDIPLEKKLKDMNLIIPKSVLTELGKSEDKSEDEISFEYSEDLNNVIFSVGNNVVSSRVIDSSFPDFENIIPKVIKLTAVCPKDELKEAVQTVGVFAREESLTVKLTVENDALVFSTESSRVGTGKSSVDAKIEGETGIEILFNCRFLEEFLNNVEGKDVSIELSSTDEAGIFKDLSDPHYLHLIMPIKI